MESEYGIGVKNRYALLDSDDDPFEALVQIQKKKELKKKPDIVKDVKPAKSVVKKASKPEPPAVDKEPKIKEADPGPDHRTKFPDKPKKKEFDRHSGSTVTGVKPIEKRQGAGAHNWGSTKDLIEDTQEEWGMEKPIEAPDEPIQEIVVERPPTPEPEQMTLDEWKARKARIKPTYNIRKAGEGEDLSKWKNMVEYRKKIDDDDSEEEYDPSQFPQRVGRRKFLYDIQIQFNDKKQLGNLGRNGKSRYRERNDGQFNEGGEEGCFEKTDKIFDEEDFPTLKSA